jgi:acetylornithine deacetylase
LLNAHLDTVGVAGMDTAHAPRITDGRLYGRGAYDMKGALAAILDATARARQHGLRGDVVLTAVADEEVASIGTDAVLARLDADAAIVVEPTELAVAIAHKGFVGFELETTGVAAHGSRPDLGVDAIVKMGPVLTALGELDRELASGRRHPLLGRGSVHASLIEGGQEFSSYPDRCVVTGERRTIPGETAEDVRAELLTRAGEADVRIGLARPPFEGDPDAAFTRVVRTHAGDAVLVGVPYWADSALIAAAGIPTVLYGPAGAGAHATEEWVDLQSLETVRDAVLSIAVEWCR